jgi:hypothetical protein
MKCSYQEKRWKEVIQRIVNEELKKPHPPLWFGFGAKHMLLYAANSGNM